MVVSFLWLTLKEFSPASVLIMVMSITTACQELILVLGKNEEEEENLFHIKVEASTRK